MGIYPIRSEADHKRALGRIGRLMDAETLTEGEDSELDALVTLVAAYEDKQFPIREATPTEVIEFMMDQRGLTRKDLEPMIGTRARVSEVLSGKRPLTLAMIRALSIAWGISADLLIAPSAQSTLHGNGSRRVSSPKKDASARRVRRNTYAENDKSSSKKILSKRG